MDRSLLPSGAESTSSMRHWKARLNLDFAHLDGRTRLAHSAHEGPLRVQRLFHPEPSGKAHCYLLHPPGGVVLGDELQIQARVRSGSALLTTPSAGRFYSVDGQDARQYQTVKLAADQGSLEWLPQETILFDGADARLETQIALRGRARLAYWDVVVLGRPASGERFTRGGLEQRLTVRRDDHLVFSERLCLRAGDRVHGSALGLNAASTIGIALFTAAEPGPELHEWCASSEARDCGGSYALTYRSGFLIARYRGENAQRCREGFAKLWSRLSTAYDGVAPAVPRIWHT